MPAAKPKPLSQRPYLIRAIYQWVVDCGFTPYMVVAADVPGVEIPRQHVQKNGQIVFNLSPMALGGINLDTDPVWFNARFGGRPMDCFVPSGAVLAIYAQELGEGMQFGPAELVGEGDAAAPAPKPPAAPARPGLSLVSSGGPDVEKADAAPAPVDAAPTARNPETAAPARDTPARNPPDGDDDTPPPPRGGRSHLRVVK